LFQLSSFYLRYLLSSGWIVVSEPATISMSTPVMKNYNHANQNLLLLLLPK